MTRSGVAGFSARSGAVLAVCGSLALLTAMGQRNAGTVKQGALQCSRSGPRLLSSPDISRCMRFRVLGPMAAACLGLVIATTTMAAPHQVRLWPKGNPGPQNGSGTEGDTTKPSDSQVAGKPVV